jgi:hypothetical protein
MVSAICRRRGLRVLCGLLTVGRMSNSLSSLHRARRLSYSKCIPETSHLKKPSNHVVEGELSRTLLSYEAPRGAAAALRGSSGERLFVYAPLREYRGLFSVPENVKTRYGLLNERLCATEGSANFAGFARSGPPQSSCILRSVTFPVQEYQY